MRLHAALAPAARPAGGKRCRRAGASEKNGNADDADAADDRGSDKRPGAKAKADFCLEPIDLGLIRGHPPHPRHPRSYSWPSPALSRPLDLLRRQAVLLLVVGAVEELRGLETLVP